MPKRNLLLMTFAMLCALTQLRCHAMLITPSSDEEAADVMREAIIRRNSFEMSPEKVLRAREEEFARQTNALKSLKAAEPQAPAQAEAESPPPIFSNVAVLLMVIAAPFAALLLLHLLTKRTMKLRELEQTAMKKTLRLLKDFVPERHKPKPPAPKIPLPEFLKIRAAREAETRVDMEAETKIDIERMEKHHSTPTPPPPPPAGMPLPVF